MHLASEKGSLRIVRALLAAGAYAEAADKYAKTAALCQEITTAIANHVRVVIVRCDGYMHPDEAYKIAAAALCRYIKCTFGADFLRIFLVSDNLFDLDLIFDVVQAETETHVVIGTRDVFRRMWRAGEITTAIANNARVVIVRCDGYMHPDEAYLYALETAWNEEEVHTLACFGMSLPGSRTIPAAPESQRGYISVVWQLDHAGARNPQPRSAARRPTKGDGQLQADTVVRAPPVVCGLAPAAVLWPSVSSGDRGAPIVAWGSSGRAVQSG